MFSFHHKTFNDFSRSATKQFSKKESESEASDSTERGSALHKNRSDLPSFSLDCSVADHF